MKNNEMNQRKDLLNVYEVKDEEEMVIYGIGIKFRNIDKNYKNIIIKYVD